MDPNNNNILNTSFNMIFFYYNAPKFQLNAFQHFVQFSLTLVVDSYNNTFVPKDIRDDFESWFKTESTCMPVT